jgi:predicted amidohydrolase
LRDIKIGAAQFEARDGDKTYNLGRIRDLTAAAVDRGAEVVSFHECCISGYTFLRRLDKPALLEIAEFVPEGPSIAALQRLSGEFKVPLLAGLLEKDGSGRLYNTYLCVDGSKVVAKFRKLHAFISPHVSSGDRYVVFDLLGCRCGILICYDNNLPENVRMTALLGAEIIFMPHVTGCLPSPMPGRGLVEPKLWENRERDLVSLRMELDGPKGRDWLMRWLPARAYENGVYGIFTNPIGMDDGQVRNGNAMILDPYGEIITECRSLGDEVTVGLCTPEKIDLSPGRRYLKARRPELYGRLAETSGEAPVTLPGW